jgi:competence ComEA-like helix-hairpin-helix protein
MGTAVPILQRRHLNMAFLTRHEKYIIVFLIIGAICGISYSYYRISHPPIDLRFRDPLHEDDILVKEFDYLLKETKSVNINRASMEELMKLNGIGPVLAHRIIEYRLKNGPIKDKDELKKVPGIGSKKFEAIKDYIVIE